VVAVAGITFTFTVFISVSLMRTRANSIKGHTTLLRKSLVARSTSLTP
jgi:hypothetical protein